ncbi:FAD-dependent oxidoreductase [Sphingomonas sp. BN140010]|uniref:FAD-dependent oxidoreductase n=1 Tax=Sphingomonas arvum TaxID=2992113 RepID=A0ABT3JCT5_9SPHN|nr:FAD-dependent oxidoreductase [Sphingomonas sp. BN140010]MCW3796878.1 FAD-dependent oxidoreductase [Sphingomonas sp. BN140010]
MKAELSRRDLLAAAGVGAGALAVGACATDARPIPGTLGGSDFRRGHRVRTGQLPEPQGKLEELPLLIAGGGVAGLAAAWRLVEAGFRQFRLIELEDETGGNARGGRNQVSAYPLGAHYLPVPNREAGALRHMLRQFGMITGEQDGAPVYDPYQLCADLEERLFWRGEWQEGLYPVAGLSAVDRADRDAFRRTMSDYSRATGKDGRPAFAVPSAYSSRDPEFLALDRLSFSQWLEQRGWRSPPLRAYVRYCCRDDYGTEPEGVSAWAGIHYFAARRGWAANGDGDRELTWPEGNQRLVRLMAQQVAGQVATAKSLVRATADNDGVIADVLDHRSETTHRVRTKAAILAMPRFVAARVAPARVPADASGYAPWIVANVTVARPPAGKGTPLAWDNVSTASNSLGYVVATHQSDSASGGPTVLTWYLPLSMETPAAARHLLLQRPLESWQALVRDDLLQLHPELAGAITRIDVWRWGHAMIRPAPGLMAQAADRLEDAVRPPLLLAHSDLSGLSLFEEAHYAGVAAAEAALRHLGHPVESLL